MKPAKLISLLLFISICCHGQMNMFLQYYPISEQPNIRYMSSYTKQETILFEANPIVKYSFYNNFYENLVNNRKCASAYYLSFRPQLRMYISNSKPVRTPSYRIFVGTQHMFRLTQSTTVQDFAGFSVESYYKNYT